MKVHKKVRISSLRPRGKGAHHDFRVGGWFGLDRRKVTAMTTARQLPPIEVVARGGRLYVEDGHHRVAARMRAGHTHINAVVDDGRGNAKPAKKRGFFYWE